MKKLTFLTTISALVLAFVAPSFGAEEGVYGANANTAYIWFTVAAAIGMSIASSMAALAQGRAVASALEGIARQPSAAGKIQTNLIIGLALIESLAIYVLVIALIVFFVQPFPVA